MRQARGDSQRSYLGRPAWVSRRRDTRGGDIACAQAGVSSGHSTDEACESGQREGPNIKSGGRLARSMDGQRRQPLPEGTCPGTVGVTPQMFQEGRSPSTAHSMRTAHEGGEATLLLEEALERNNMLRALQRVERNGGAPGVDGMTVADLRPFLRRHWERIRTELFRGCYTPQPVRRAEIPKPGGGVRALGIPTVLDRLIQQALLQVLTPIFDPHFSSHSYGYRPGRRAHDAVWQARVYVREGSPWVVDLDLDRFFDRVNHDMLMARVARRVQDKRVLKLLRAYLNAGAMVDGVVIETAEGTPQGGPVSPLLANILLDDLDQELGRRGHRFIRYADDCNIYVRSQRAGERVLASVMHWIETRLKLRVNREKSAVDRAHRREVLGFTFLPGTAAKIRIAPQALRKVKGTLRRLTRRSRSQSMVRRVRAVNEYLRGWIGYFALAETPSVITGLEEWVRRRLRLCLWGQWGRIRTRYRELRRLGASDRNAFRIANSRLGPWRIAGRALGRHLGTDFWEKQGLESVMARYHRLRTAW